MEAYFMGIDTGTQGVRIVYTQFPEDILPVAVYRMEAEVSFGSYFFGCFPEHLVLWQSQKTGWKGLEKSRV